MQFRSDMTVKLIDSNVGDEKVVQAARVSVMGANSAVLGNSEEKLISYLMRNRHGSPFEHGSMTFYIEAPIFVFREFHRHRIGWSYNEESARYKELDPTFYVPARERNLVQRGKPGAYEYVAGSEEQYDAVRQSVRIASGYAFDEYEHMLKAGIAREVARMCLPVNIYSSMYATCNARSLMAFLSLRTQRPYALFESRPMAEIDTLATEMEKLFSTLMPITHQAYEDGGRVAP